MVSIAIFGGGACAKSHIQSFSRLTCANDLSIKVYTNNPYFSFVDSGKYFHSFAIDTPDYYSKNNTYDIVLIANKSSDHPNTWKLAHSNIKALTIIEKPFAASLVSNNIAIKFLFSNSFVLFQKRMLFLDQTKEQYLQNLCMNAANNSLIHLETRLVKHSSVLKKLEKEYKGLSLKNIILLHFSIHEIDLIEFCSNSKIVEINSNFKVVKLEKSMISIEGLIEGCLQNGLNFSINYMQDHDKLPKINIIDSSKGNKINQYKDTNWNKSYTNMSEIRQIFWEQVINGNRHPLRRLTSCISLENLIIR